MRPEKAEIQNRKYAFPYHYLPSLRGNDSIALHRQLPWGLDYLTYMTFLADRVAELKPASLLDVGCGAGRFFDFVQDKVGYYKGVDLSVEAIGWAKCFNPGVDFEACDCNDLGEQYEVVSLIEVLEHIPDTEVESFVESIHELVKPQGHFLLSVPSVNIPLNPKHYRHYDENLLRSHIGKKFDIVAIWWVYAQGKWEWLFRHLLINRVFTLNHNGLRRTIWRLHRKVAYMANPKNGTHVTCLARPKPD